MAFGARETRCLYCRRATQPTLPGSPATDADAAFREPTTVRWVEPKECPYCRGWGKQVHELELQS